MSVGIAGVEVGIGYVAVDMVGIGGVDLIVEVVLDMSG